MCVVCNKMVLFDYCLVTLLFKRDVLGALGGLGCFLDIFHKNLFVDHPLISKYKKSHQICNI